jgi:hypothetical protein
MKDRDGHDQGSGSRTYFSHILLQRCMPGGESYPWWYTFKGSFEIDIQSDILISLQAFPSGQSWAEVPLLCYYIEPTLHEITFGIYGNLAIILDIS